MKSRSQSDVSLCYFPHLDLLNLIKKNKQETHDIFYLYSICNTRFENKTPYVHCKYYTCMPLSVDKYFISDTTVQSRSSHCTLCDVRLQEHELFLKEQLYNLIHFEQHSQKQLKHVSVCVSGLLISKNDKTAVLG